jgi:hypothetical protein
MMRRKLSYYQQQVAIHLEVGSKLLAHLPLTLMGAVLVVVVAAQHLLRLKLWAVVAVLLLLLLLLLLPLLLQHMVLPPVLLMMPAVIRLLLLFRQPVLCFRHQWPAPRLLLLPTLRGGLPLLPRCY